MKSKVSLLEWAFLLILFAPAISKAAFTPSNGDLAVGKTASTNSVKVGDTVVFTLLVTNLGPDIVTNVTVQDFLPVGLAYVSSSGVGTYSPTGGMWNFSAGAAGVVSIRTITAQALSVGTYTNTATIVASSATDTNSSNNSASAGVTVRPLQADLAIAKTASTNSIKAGGYMSFQLTVTNLGPDTATNVTVYDILPSGFVYGTSSGTGTFDALNHLWTFSASGPGSVSSLTIFVQATNVGVFTNHADINSSNIGDTNAANNSASAAVTVFPRVADLRVTKFVSTNNIQLGQQVVFTITVENAGPDDATGELIVTDCLPPTFQYITDTTVGNSSPGTYSPGTCKWTLPNGLFNGSAATLQIVVQATSVGTFTNTASVAVPPTFNDPVPTNNSASVAMTVYEFQTDLAVTKTVDTNSLPINGLLPFNFRLTVTNLGPGTVSNLTLADLVPAGLNYSSAVNGPDSSFNPTNRVWTIINPLAPGQGSAMTLGLRGTNAGTFTNILTINLPPGVRDSNTNNNTAKSVVTVLPVYTISGYVNNCQSNGLALANVKVTLSGAANRTTTTLPGGFYSFDFVSNGNYTITPSQPGNVFVPLNRNVTVSNSSLTAPPFVGSVGLIYGALSYFGNPVTQHPVILIRNGFPPTARFVFTDANGYYTFTNTPAGNYTVIPVVTNGYAFTQTNAALTLDATNCAGLANFFASKRRTVQLVALEVVQVIQDWSNSVPLVKDKETYVRAHLQLTNTIPVLIQGARLHGTGAGGAILPGSPLSPIPPATLSVQTANAASVRAQFANSLNFRLPDDWLTGTISLRFEGTNNVTVSPTNAVPANSTVAVTFTPSSPLPIVIFPVNWERTADGILQTNTPGNLADLPRRLLSILPVPRVVSTLGQPVLAAFTAQPVQGDYGTLNTHLTAIRQIARFFVPENRLYHGAVASGSGRGATGEAPMPGTVSSALMPNNADFYSDRWLRHLATHELGHNFGRDHDVHRLIYGTSQAGRVANGACNGEQGGLNYNYPLIQPAPTPAGPPKPTLGPMTNGVNSLVFGLDTLTLRTAPEHNPVADPNLDFDVMSYCDHAPLQWWISTLNYSAFFTSITNSFVPPVPPPPLGGARRWFFIRGPVDLATNTGSFLPFYAMDTTSGYLPPTPAPGDYSLRLFDNVGNLLDEIFFAPDADAPESLGTEDAPPATGSFMIPVLTNLYTAVIERVELWVGGTNLLAQRIASPNPPQFVSPPTATQTSNTVHLTWSAINALHYAIQFSADAGATWTTLAIDWTQSAYDANSNYLQPTANGRFRVIASDDFSSATESSLAPIIIASRAPQVSINAPRGGSLFIGDEQIFLDASASDAQDGTLTGASIAWTSSVNGALGNGEVLNFEAGALSEGTHIITVTATDSLNLTGSASVKIHVLRSPPPSLGIQLAGNHALLTWPSSVTNYVLESTLALPTTNWFTVTNVPVAADAEQTVTVDIATTSKFYRLRMP